MSHILARFKVQDYSRWKAVFDERASKRQEGGIGHSRIFRNSEDPNDIALLLEVNDQEKARQFANSQELKDAQQRGGVISPPTMTWVDEAA